MTRGAADPPAADSGDHTDSIADLPSAPGVYLFRARDGELLYVGKARRLRHRVRSYFRPPASLPLRTRSLVRHISRVEALVVRSEREALLLEASLIRAHRPRYNQRLKDSRGYPLLRIDRHGPTPNAALTSTLRDDGAAYFGPFPEAGRINEALNVMRRLYLLHPGFPDGEHSRLRADLRRMTSELLDLLAGHGRAVQERIEQAMHAAAAFARRSPRAGTWPVHPPWTPAVAGPILRGSGRASRSSYPARAGRHGPEPPEGWTQDQISGPGLSPR